MLLDLIVPFFNIFQDENLPVWLSLGLFSAGFLCFLAYYFHVYLPIRRSLHRANGRLEHFTDASFFCANFTSLDPIFTDSGLKHNWDEFKKTLILPKPYEEPKVIRNTIRPYKYFNFEGLSQRYNISFYQALPNIIVGVGLLLTFCGLVSAIYLTGKSIGIVHTEDAAMHTESLKHALDSLLRVAAFKFLTSIAGLITSLLLTIEIRLCNGRLRNEYDRLNTLLERNMLFESQEQLISRQQDVSIRQLEYLREHTERMRVFTETFARENAQKTALAINALLKMYGERLSEQIVPTLTYFSEQISAASRDAMTHLVQEFRDCLHAESAKEVQALTTSLTRTCQTVETVAKHLQEGANGLSAASEKAANTVGSMMTSLSKTVTQGTEESVAHLEAALERVAAVLEANMRSSSDTLTTTGAELKETLASAAQNLQQMLEEARRAFESERSAMTQEMQTTLNSCSEALKTGLGGVVSSLESAGANASKTWEQSATQVAASVQTYASTMQTIAEGNTAHLSSALRELSEHVTKMLAKTETEYELLQTTVRAAMDSAAKGFGGAMQAAEDALIEQARARAALYKNTTAETLKMLEQQGASTQTSLQAAEQRFSHVLEETKMSISAISKAVTQHLEETLGKASEVFAASLQTSGAQMEQGLQKTRETFFDIENTVCSTIAVSSDTFTSTVQNGTSSLAKMIGEETKLLQTTMEMVRSALEKSLQANTENVSTLETGLRNTLALSEKRLTATVRDISETYSRGADNSAEALTQAVSKAAKDLEARLHAVTASLEEVFAKIESQFVQTTDTCLGTLTQTFETCTATTEERLTERQAKMAEEVQSVARQLVQSMEKGMTSVQERPKAKQRQMHKVHVRSQRGQKSHLLPKKRVQRARKA